MAFIDEAVIHLRAGDGGNGVAAFRREDGVPRGGPSGGDGGNGGSIIVVADPQLSSLLDFKYRRHYKGERGEDGRSKDQYGAGGEDLIVRVPVGTMIYRVADAEAAPGEADEAADEADEAADEADDEADAESDEAAAAGAAPAPGVETRTPLADLTEAGARFVIAKGGRGGKGNIHFKSPWNQAPTTCEPGTPGAALTVRLELKLLADVGLLGYPNVGKSTFISHVSRARPKVADYPFTTLVPNLGVVRAPGDRDFLVADLPGLIEGAHRGAGLGDRFLRHIERCKTLVYLVEPHREEDGDPVSDFTTTARELKLYDPSLAKRPSVVALSKIDTIPAAELKKVAAAFGKKRKKFFAISAVTGKGLKELINHLADVVEKSRRSE